MYKFCDLLSRFARWLNSFFAILRSLLTRSIDPVFAITACLSFISIKTNKVDRPHTSNSEKEFWKTILTELTLSQKNQRFFKQATLVLCLTWKGSLISRPISVKNTPLRSVKGSIRSSFKKNLFFVIPQKFSRSCFFRDA